jgi:xylose isomerase
MSFYSIKDPIKFEGPSSENTLAYRYYNPDQKVLGKTMREHLRFAVCYWHTLCWPGGDPFGGETFMREWHHMSDPMKAAEKKAEVMFETLRLLDIDFFTFHDLDIAPEGNSLQEFNTNVSAIAKIVGYGQHVLEPALHGWCCDQSRSGCLCLLRGAGETLPRCDERSGW